MHTLPSSARSDEHDRLQDYADLTQDIRLPITDRLALRLGLWLLLSGARRAGRRTDQSTARDERRLRAIACEAYYRRVRDEAFVRAAVSNQYR